MTLFDEKVGNSVISTAKSLRSIGESLERMAAAMETLAAKLPATVGNKNEDNENETEKSGS